MSDKRPIGIFDSGYGGLTVLKEVVGLLPGYDYIYLGDNARTPYGTRSFDVVYAYTREAVRYLTEQGCPLVILACNTASAKALRSIQQLDIPVWGDRHRVLGVIRPSVEHLASISENRHVGILGTRGTVLSDSYLMEVVKLYGKDEYAVTQIACPMFVPLVENNELSGAGAEFFVKKYTGELFDRDPDIDTIVLACTHYPLLKELILRYVPAYVKVVEQGKIVADSLKDYLKRHPEIEERLSKGASVRYLTTEKAPLFEEMAGVFMDRTVRAEEVSL